MIGAFAFIGCVVGAYFCGKKRGYWAGREAEHRLWVSKPAELRVADAQRRGYPYAIHPVSGDPTQAYIEDLDAKLAELERPAKQQAWEEIKEKYGIDPDAPFPSQHQPHQHQNFPNLGDV